MGVTTLNVRIDAPTGKLLPGRGFYQRDEETLNVQVGEMAPHRRCFSYLEAETVRLDLDQQGQLMGVEVAQPRRHWKLQKNLRLPRIAEPADVRWLDFRRQIPEPELLRNTAGDRLLLKFMASESWRWYLLAENIHVQIDSDSQLAAILISDIAEDFAGRNISRYRKRLGRAYAKEHEAASHPASN